MKPTEVFLTDEFVTWLEQLGPSEREAVERLIALVELSGVSLGFPYSSALQGARFPLRELRKRGQPLRIIYAFDPRRDAVMILGGDKTGRDRFYEEMIPRAEKIWAQYLKELEAGLHPEED